MRGAAMEYESDPKKAAANFVAHGVSFDSAQDFEWDSALEWYDEMHSDAEDRYVALGFIGDVLHVMAHTKRSAKVRITSLRKANKLERKHYAESQSF